MQHFCTEGQDGLDKEMDMELAEMEVDKAMRHLEKWDNLKRRQAPSTGCVKRARKRWQASIGDTKLDSFCLEQLGWEAVETELEKRRIQRAKEDEDVPILIKMVQN